MKQAKPGGRRSRAPEGGSRRRAVSPALLADVRKEARAFFHDARGSHDWDHTERVARLCLRIGGKEGADLGILTLAALLHDIGRGEEDRSGGKICHGRSGAAMAGKLLARHGLDPATVRAVVHCIRTHRFRKRAVPQTLEAKVLFDADKLDSIGAVGIGRAFLFAGEVGARLHDKDIDVRKTKPYTREDTAYREFLVKLGRVKDRIFTREGRRIAAERHRFMVAFFDRLNRETDGRL
ncbi:MAG: HD domain-containing protein [Acidobacteriota bacterium]